MASRSAGKRLRLVALQPIFMVDDGESLRQLSIDPLPLSEAELPEFVERFEEAKKALERQINEGA